MKERIYYEINEQSARTAHEMMSFRDYQEQNDNLKVQMQKDWHYEDKPFAYE